MKDRLILLYNLFMKFFKELTNVKKGKKRYHFRIYESELKTLYALLTKVKAFTPKTFETMHYHGMIRNMHKTTGNALKEYKNPRTREIGSRDVRKIYNNLAKENQ